ncbi:hypothetical protein [Erythrobacter sp.]|uniref:hypothetical protein n=1 Tax=Erythrobacter sp. TaxID=1042 RepID=UPI001B16B404|nr:hypothetical protein [Erythrobacter sp.]MBO6527965.1 hypothetical protein [Erythrobacter sp.]MBO6528642.1 hypothetical protein [Erythrobacter sp.]
MMLEALEEALIDAVRDERTLTYAELTAQLQIRPPHSIHRTALLLERLMRDQAAQNVPQLASFVVSRARAGLPAPGFFILLRELGLYDGPDTGQLASAFIEAERTRCRNFW